MHEFIRKKYAQILPKPVLEKFMEVVEHPPFVAGHGGPLEMMRRDHTAIAVRDFHELVFVFDYIVQNGHVPINQPYLWPDSIENCPEVPMKLKKYMAEIQIGSEVIVLLAPFSSDDLIAQTIRRVGNPAIHHVAYRVSNIQEMRERLLQMEGVSEISDLAIDEGKLSQIFLSIEADHRIVELIERAPDYVENFTCKNVETLTKGEAKHARNAE